MGKTGWRPSDVFVKEEPEHEPLPDDYVPCPRCKGEGKGLCQNCAGAGRLWVGARDAEPDPGEPGGNNE